MEKYPGEEDSLVEKYPEKDDSSESSASLLLEGYDEVDADVDIDVDVDEDSGVDDGLDASDKRKVLPRKSILKTGSFSQVLKSREKESPEFYNLPREERPASAPVPTSPKPVDEPVGSHCVSVHFDNLSDVFETGEISDAGTSSMTIIFPTEKEAKQKRKAVSMRVKTSLIQFARSHQCNKKVPGYCIRPHSTVLYLL